MYRQKYIHVICFVRIDTVFLIIGRENFKQPEYLQSINWFRGLAIVFIYLVHMYRLVLINLAYGEKIQSYALFSILGLMLTILSIMAFKMVVIKCSINSRVFIGC